MTLPNVLGRPRKYELGEMAVGDNRIYPLTGDEVPRNVSNTLLSSAKNTFGKSGYIKTRAVMHKGALAIKVTRIK